MSEQEHDKPPELHLTDAKELSFERSIPRKYGNGFPRLRFPCVIRSASRLTCFPADGYTGWMACLDPVLLQEDRPMSRKLFACGLLLVVGLGLSLAGRVSSQDKDVDKVRRDVAPDPGTPHVNLDQLVQELKNVRAQKAELDRREQQLMAALESRINAERQQLDQKVQERRRHLDEIERLIHRDAKGKDAKAVERYDFKK